MGLFDSVIADCTKCGSQVVFQSKAGVCDLKRYHMHSVPPEVARDIDGDTETCECGYVIRLLLAKPIPLVRMFVSDGLKGDEAFD